MREAMAGNWILQEYEDSIDAGLTPKLLEYMLDKPNSIAYGIDPQSDSLHPDNLIGMVYQHDKSEELNASFKYAESRIDFFSLQQKSKHVASAQFLIDSPDAILRVSFDSLPRPLDFVKYDVGSCPHMTAYSHLINSKFIAGKYYRSDDTARKHHIIFTRCGNIEGAQNIDESMRNYEVYTVLYVGFKTNPDIVLFINAQYNKADMLSWEVSGDSLILRRERDPDERRIVLVKG